MHGIPATTNAIREIARGVLEGQDSHTNIACANWQARIVVLAVAEVIAELNVCEAWRSSEL